MTHNHSHSHGEQRKDFSKAFIIGILLNSIFIITEVIYGIKANSLALLADAGHNIGDVLGLFLAWGAMLLAKRKSSERFTYGMQSSTIMAGLLNAILLLVAIGGIGWEAIGRLYSIGNTHINTGMVVWVAVLGILINGVTACLFIGGSKKDLNIRGAFLHMAADAGISLGVVVSGLIIMQTGISILDPIISLVIAAIIVYGTWGLLADSVNMALHAVPKDIDYAKVKAYLNTLDGVNEIHDLHIWAMSTTDFALSAHLLMDYHPKSNFLKTIEHTLEHDFQIGHSTIQIEVGKETGECKLSKGH